MPKDSPQNKEVQSPAESLQDQLMDIQDEAKKNKVKLTLEVGRYIREHLETVQQKLANREPVMEDDMKFMQDVRTWVGLPEEWREKYKSIEGMNKSEENQDTIKRGIRLGQWLILLNIARWQTRTGRHGREYEKEWIDETFSFPGNFQIVSKPWGQLQFRNIDALPENLEVKGNLYLENVGYIKSIPNNLVVKGKVSLATFNPEKLNPQVYEDLERLRKEGKIKDYSIIDIADRDSAEVDNY